MFININHESHNKYGTCMLVMSHCIIRDIMLFKQNYENLDI